MADKGFFGMLDAGKKFAVHNYVDMSLFIANLWKTSRSIDVVYLGW
jgi:hypothetical protein